MPAQEDTYRPQKGLHIVFAVSSILMFLSIIWMMADDHLREWKKLQRDFIRLEAAKMEQETGPKKLAKDIEELETQLAQEKKAVASAVRDAQRKVNSLLGDVQKK